jgi:MYXO-CTERM domain-containing protein
VDLATTIGPATHVGSGSLYGVIEDIPADVNGLVAPLRPKMFTNPAANVQQPHGDAIVVAQRLAPVGAQVTIRLADWFPGWPYEFSDMTDWLDKIAETVARKQASGVDNYYGYEIWNEPTLTWSGPPTFNDFWKQTYDELRALDPGADIIGASLAWCNIDWLRDFLTFGRDNDCLPDIIAWHELGGGDVGGSVQNYRALEQQLGIGPLRISINEYGGDDEGQPGATAPLIAKFERFGVDTACLSFWDVAHAGRLSSLLATDADRNGGWWFFKWYGDMSGNMVATVPASPDDGTTLDGFANLDASTQVASVLFAGDNDGAVRVLIRGFDAVPFFGSQVSVVVEHTPWGDHSIIVNHTDTVSSTEVPITNGEIEVTVPNTNDEDGFRISLTPVATGTGGASGAGGSAGSAGSAGSVGVGGSGTGGDVIGSGGSGIGGDLGTGGEPGVGGSGIGGDGTGGGGTTGVGGSTGSGGMADTGGTSAEGGTTGAGGSGNLGGTTTSGGTDGSSGWIETGGAMTSGGMVGSGGMPAAGGFLATGGADAVGPLGGAGAAEPPDGGASDSEASGDDGGCGCRVTERPTSPLSLVGASLLGLLLSRRRRLRRG